MTVASEASSSTQSWTGVETAFAGGFKAKDAGDVQILFTSSLGVESALTNGVHFTASLGGAGDVTVTPVALPPAPGTLFIYRQTPAVQPTDFINLASFDPAVHTDLHDRAALRDAEIRRDVTRVALEAIMRGWSPVIAVVADGARFVLKVTGWTGGEGTAPAANVYIGAAGFVAAIADAVDIRGPVGAGAGDVVGPAGGSAQMMIAFFADTTGKLLREALTLTPAELTANVSDYAPAGHATAFLFRLTADAARNVTGLAGGAKNRMALIVNPNANAIVLKNEDASSAAANRFAVAGDVELKQNETLLIAWDETSSRWRRYGGALADASVRTRHFSAGAVDSAALGDGSVTPPKLGGAVAASINTQLWANFR